HVRTGLSGDTRYPGQVFEFRRLIILTKHAGVWLILAGQNAKLEEKPAAGSKQPPAPLNKKDEYNQMLDYSHPGAQHLALGTIAGHWTFQDAKLAFVKGTLERKPIFEGRFYAVEITGGKLPLPVADGKMKEDSYRGLQTEGYDNARGEYVTSSVNNHIGSDIQLQTGSYDAATKTFTYYWESELIRGIKVKNKRTLKITDISHYVEEYFEEREGQYIKVRELDYTKTGD
ncbi:MAG: DUF1579 family protein, partial [Bacteroidetes bacterium]|nr:DUF1579 family protein [Bacteroidota bacterium]